MSSPSPLPGVLASLGPILDDYGYLAVAGLVFVEDFGIPVPGETVLIAASVYAGVGRMNIVAVGLIAVAAAVVGDNIGYLIGRTGGRALALRRGWTGPRNSSRGTAARSSPWPGSWRGSGRPTGSSPGSAACTG